MKIAIPLEKIQKIFPSKPPFLNLTQKVSQEVPYFSLFLEILEHAVGMNSAFLLPNKDTKEIDFYFQTEENGGFISGIEYNLTNNDNLPSRYFAIVIGEISLQDIGIDKTHIMPHFILAGTIDRLDDVEVIYLDTFLCRTPQNEFGSKTVLNSYSRADEVQIYKALCFAEDCFKRILAGLPIDISVSQSWLKSSDQELDHRINLITSRTENEWLREIENLRKQSLLADASLFKMIAPSGMQ